MKELIVQVNYGLCNRLRAFMSASYLAERYGRKLVLCWTPGSDCGGRFADLFASQTAEIEALPIGPPAWQDPCDRTELAKAVQSAEPVVCVSTCAWLVFARARKHTVRYFCDLRPLETVAQAVQTVAGKFGGRTMGVHVRRGDFAQLLPNRYGIELPPLEMYFRRLDGWRGTIFLATDGGDEVEQRFRERYGNRLLTHTKSAPGRDAPESVRDALVDLYLLQRCHAVIGTNHSSFTDLAGLVSRRPLLKLGTRPLLHRLASRLARAAHWARPTGR